MKFLFRLLGLTLALAPLLLAAQDGLYARSIFVQNLDEDVLKRSVEDLRRYLTQATGKSFSVSTAAGSQANGIFIGLLQNRLPSTQEKALQNGSIEDFVLSGDDKKLLITATHPLGLSRGIYSYLDKLGVKWYLPGDEWTVVPSLQTVVYREQSLTAPSFTVRDFFGTGDLLPLPAIDPSSALRTKWADWKRRNRMGGAYVVAGHYGEVFNDKHRDVLQQHPEYMALVDGKRGWHLSSKWCVSNEGLRRLFVDDRVQALKQALAQSRYPTEKIVLSVDPTDAYGDCQCEACKKMGKPSDRDFFLANETAKAFEKISSRAYVSLFAYSTHAAPPRFALTNRVIVYVIPYAYQDVGTPEQLIALWKKRHNNLAMYDYYGVTDWHWNAPLAGDKWGLQAMLTKMRSWQKDGFNGVLFESTLASGNTGLGLYLLTRLGWNARENTAATEQNFYQQLFGKAAGYASLYFQRVSNTGFTGAADLPYLLDLLEKASKAAPEAAVQKRLFALKSYLHFLVLYYQQVQTPGNEDLRKNLFDYALQLYHTGTVHSTRIAELMLQQQPTGALRERWNRLTAPGQSVVATPITDKQLEALFQQDRAQYPLLEGFEYVSKAAEVQYELSSSPVAKQAPAGEGLLILEWPETYVRPSANGKIAVYLKVNERSENNNSQRYPVQLIDTATGRVAAEKIISIDRNWLTVELTAPAGKTYKLVSKHTNWIRLAVPQSQWLAFRNVPTYTEMGRLWFYNDADFLYYNNTAKDQPAFVDAKGKSVQPEKVNDMGLYRVRLSGGKNQWWTLEGSAYKFLQFHKQHFLLFPNGGLQAKRLR